MCGPSVKIPNFVMEIPHVSMKIPNLDIFPINGMGLPFQKRQIDKACLKKQLKAYHLGFDALCCCSMSKLGVAVNQAGS